jgi:parallel beta-helix repeat protein
MRAALACVALLAPIISTSCASPDGLTDPSRNAAESASGRHRTDVLPVTTIACGAQIAGDAKLDNDLACTGNGFTVSGDDITIDLNGHSLSGNGTGNGITVNASHRVRIFGGSITRFQSGIFVGGSTDVEIRDNEFSATNQAVLFQATVGSVIKHNTVANNLGRAFMLRPNLTGGQSTDNVVVGNLVIGTPTGIYLIRQPGNTILENTIIGATIAGVDLAEGSGQVSGTIVRANHLTGGGAGIRFSAGWIDNTIVGNRIESNVCGLQGPSSGNTLTGNVLSGNAVDTCP